MRHFLRAVFIAVLLLASLSRIAHAQPRPHSSPQAVEQAVRAFMQTVAHDVTHDGPGAWHRFFLDSPQFFMASEGQLVFSSHAAADKDFDKATAAIKHIELTWGGEVRVDPLTPTLAVVATPWHEVRTMTSGRVEQSGFFTGTVELRDGHWQFRDLHWSVVEPGTPAPKPVQQ